MVGGDAKKRVEDSTKYLNTWIKVAIGDASHEIVPYIKDRYLSGQALNKITGTTYGSVQTWYSQKKKAWFIRPGVRVAGSLNYLGKWAGTEHEFMQPAFDSWMATHDLADKIAKKVDKKL